MSLDKLMFHSPKGTWSRVLEAHVNGVGCGSPPKKGITTNAFGVWYYDKRIALYDRKAQILWLRVRDGMFTVHGKDAVHQLSTEINDVQKLRYAYLYFPNITNVTTFETANDPYLLEHELHPPGEPGHKHHCYLYSPTRIDSAVESIQNHILSVKDSGLNDYAIIHGEFVGDLLPQHTSYTKLSYLDGVWSISVERLTPKQRRHLTKGEKPIPYNAIKLIPRSGPDVSGL